MSVTRASRIHWGTGVSGWLLQLTNRTSTPCVLTRRPRLLLVDANGVLPFTVVYHRRCVWQCAAIRRRGAQSRTINVQPHRAVFVAFSNYRCDGRTLRYAERVRLGPRPPVAVRLPDFPVIGWCGRSDPGSRLDLSPLERTAREAVARS